MKQLYDNFEVQFVGEFNNGHENFCEVILENDEKETRIEEALTTFWTLYGHRPEGGVEAIGDFNDEQYTLKLCNYFNSLLEQTNQRNPRLIGDYYDVKTLS